MTRTVTALAALLLALPAAALAQDEGRGIGYAAEGPAFDLPEGVSVERQEVHVSLQSVRLAYVFKSPGPRNVHFGFTLPDMPVDASPDAIGVAGGDEAAGLAADTQPVNYLNLAVRANGRPLALAGHGRALLDGKDVTQRLLDAGVPLLYDLDGEAPWPKLAPETRAALEADGLLQLGAALWTYQAGFEWDQPLPASETRVEMSYVPVADYWSDITLGSFPEIAPDGPATRAYCIDDAVRRAFLSGKRHYDLYTVTHFSGGGHRPAGRYRLVVDKDRPDDMVAFCPLEARKISPTRFEWKATDHAADGRIGVLFFSHEQQ